MSAVAPLFLKPYLHLLHDPVKSSSAVTSLPATASYGPAFYTASIFACAYPASASAWRFPTHYPQHPGYRRYFPFHHEMPPRRTAPHPAWPSSVRAAATCASVRATAILQHFPNPEGPAAFPQRQARQALGRVSPMPPFDDFFPSFFSLVSLLLFLSLSCCSSLDLR